MHAHRPWPIDALPLPALAARLARWVRLGLLALLASGLPAGAAAGDAVWQARANLAAVVGSAACRSDADCQTIALPSQACGGPQGWLAYAPATTDLPRLQQALQALADAEQRLPGARVSTCAVVPDPGAMCMATARASAASAPRSCELRTRRAGPPLQDR